MKKENLVLEEIKKDVKEILEILKNPKKESDNERRYNQNYPQKKEIILKTPNAPATKGQKDCLIAKGYQGNLDELTQIEASELIKGYINRDEKKY